MEILEENNWFTRPREFFFLFEQPLVPMFSKEGLFAIKHTLELNMKPGGHGIIWQLMQTNGVFKWFQSLKRDKLIVRQINNPLAGTDKNLLALAGKGARDKKAFGFLSCPRLAKTAEGMNVALITHNEDGFLTTITNVEYTDFSDRGLKDEPAEGQGSHSYYPANTNILFGAIKAIKKALKRLPLPGLLVNFKTDVITLDKNGREHSQKGGRLETTMQNIADVMTNFSTQREIGFSELNTFILFNRREKTLSCAKKKWRAGHPLTETPPGAWLDLQKNWHELFTLRLGFTLPGIAGVEDPAFLIQLHPALGPLWEVIAQKIQTGSLKKGSDLKLDASEVFIQNFHLDGSFEIRSTTLMGRAYLKNITIKNLGIRKSDKNCFWSGEVQRDEKISIILQGESEFHAENLTLEGSHTFEVPDGYRLSLSSSKGKIKTLLEKIDAPSWKWDYRITKEGSVLLTFNSKNSTFHEQT